MTIQTGRDANEGFSSPFMDKPHDMSNRLDGKPGFRIFCQTATKNYEEVSERIKKMVQVAVAGAVPLTENSHPKMS